MPSNAKVSIIMPVYNSEKYLEESILSVLESTFTAWELLLADDGSTDGSISICRSFAKKDPRIRFIQSEHGGVSHARNTAIANASGEYLFFIDSDDLIHPYLLEHLMKPAIEKNIDIASELLLRFNDSKVSHNTEGNAESTIIFGNSKLVPYYLHNTDKIGRIGGSLIKTALVTDGFDERFYRGEDTLFLYKAFLKADSFALLNEKWYYYRIHNTNAISNHDFNNSINLLQCNLEMVRLSEETANTEYVRLTASLTLYNYAFLLSHTKLHRNKELKKQLKEYAKENLKPLFSLTDFKFKKMYFLICYAYPLYHIYTKFKHRLNKKELTPKAANSQCNYIRISPEKIMPSNAKVSIIMPVYNSEKYLEESILSVLESTFTAWELLLADDGSTDGSISICRSFAEKDSRIRFIQSEHVGVSHARNTAIANASGEYLFFLDSDDLIHPLLLEKLIRTAVEKDVDIATEYSVFFHLSKKPEIKKPTEGTDYITRTQNIFTYYNKNSVHLDRIGGFLVKKSLVPDGFDERFFRCEDTLYLFKAVIHAESLAVLKEEWYFYRLHEDNTILNNDYTNCINALECMLEIVQISLATEITDYIRYSAASALYRYALQLNNAKSQRNRELVRGLKKYAKIKMRPLLPLTSFNFRIKYTLNIYAHPIYRLLNNAWDLLTGK